MNKAALVTGGAKRIGKDIAIALAQTGYDIALHYGSSHDDAENTAAEIQKQGVMCKTFKCDLSRAGKVLSLIPEVKRAFQNLSLVINNASIFEKASILNTEPGVLDKQFAINFRAPFLLSRVFTKTCKKGHIINIVDARIRHNDFGYAAYTLSKKALAELTKMSAIEFAPDIRVNAIAPGIILPPAGKSTAFLDRKSKKIPLKRKGDTSDIIKAVHFLAENTFITGQIIYVDGGENL